MRNQLFDNTEIERYTNPSRVKYWIVAIAVGVSFLAFGWVLSLVPKVIRLIWITM